MDNDKLKRILDDHKLWLESNEKNGERASLQEANLQGAILKDANLEKADLRESNLQRVKFQGAKLEKADLRGADLKGAILYRVKLKNTNFDKAKLEAIRIDQSRLSEIPESLKKKYGHTFMILGLQDNETDENKIISSIEFRPEHKQAGLAILNYFERVIHQKYPEMDVGITIKQDGNKIAMIIDPPEGEKEIVEETLYEYGLVVRDELAPNMFLYDPKHVMELEYKLDFAKAEARHWEKLYLLESTRDKERFETLEMTVGKLLEANLEYAKQNITITLPPINVSTTHQSTQNVDVDITLKQERYTIKPSQISELTEAIEKNLHRETRLSEKQLFEIKSNIEMITKELQKSKPRFFGIKDNLRSILIILMGTAGSLAASPLWEFIKQFIKVINP